MTVSLCETDPVLLKSMLVFLQEEPAVKAPPSLLNFENIVQQISDAGANAMITLSRANDFNFFFFRDGIGAVAHYANQAYIRPEGMTIEEEVLLYAFQPGDKVIAYIFRDLITAMSEDSIRFDKESLYELLTVGYLDNRRRGNAETLPLPDGASKNRRSSDTNKTPMAAAIEGIEKLIKEEPKSPSAILSVESGPLQGERFTVTLPCTIGRKECDFVLDDRLISRRHAEIKIVEKRLVIEDLASTNGTKVNGKPVSKKQLTPSDLISIGPTSFRVSPA
ncbi:MAG: FHA domain-containing protein [Desulfuromonadales bacterium]